MSKDYKHRVRSKYTLNPQNVDAVKNLSLWKWMLITAVAISVVVLLAYVSGLGVKDKPTHVAVSKNTEPVETNEKVEEPEVKAVQFDFYTILPEKEVIVPDYEIKARTREEQIGQPKTAKYIMQAGSYNDLKQAELMRAKLAAMGIEAKIQKARVGNTIWYRVKLGPFSQITSVNTINSRLKKNGIDVIVTEAEK